MHTAPTALLALMCVVPSLVGCTSTRRARGAADPLRAPTGAPVGIEGDAALRGAALATLLQPPPKLDESEANKGGPPAAPERTFFYEADLPAGVWERLVALDDEHAQRRFALLWTGIEAKVDERILASEAQRRQIGVAQLLRDEVESKVGTPSEEAIRDLWSTYRHMMQTSFAAAREPLRQLWRRDRAKQLQQALVDRLRANTELKLALEVPRLSRQAVRLGGAPRRGAPQGQVTLVAFGDYECPYSAQARRLLQSLEELYPERLTVVYRDYILPKHPRGRAAAQAAACAAEQGQPAYWAYFNLLYDNNQSLEADDLSRYARQAELDLSEFTACLASERPKAVVAQSRLDAESAQVSGTPALFINGMRVQGVLPLPLMQALVEHELGA